MPSFHIQTLLCRVRDAHPRHACPYSYLCTVPCFMPHAYQFQLHSNHATTHPNRRVHSYPRAESRVNAACKQNKKQLPSFLAFYSPCPARHYTTILPSIHRDTPRLAGRAMRLRGTRIASYMAAWCLVLSRCPGPLSFLADVYLLL